MLIDISPPITESLAVWPGDVPFRRTTNNAMSAGDAFNLSSIETTTHLGAHIDGECHYKQGGRGIDEWPLDRFVGPCEVVFISADRNTTIAPEQLPATTAERILIATNTRPDPNIFNEDYAGLHPDTVAALAGRGVMLIGIDTPSVDLFQDTSLPAHQSFADHGITILEGLVLAHVPAGAYDLLALPLRIPNCDGSPVRAVLRRAESEGRHI